MSDIIDRYDSLKVRAIQIKAEVSQSERAARELKFQYDEIVKKLKTEKESSVILESSINVLKEIVDKVSQEHIERIVDLLSYALQTIFFDKSYAVEIVMGDKRNAKTAELYLVETANGKVVRSPFEDAIGGGIISIVGFVLQVYYLGFLNKSPVMFLDESFSQVSSQYVPGLMAFIKELATSREFIFVLISHDERLNQYADKTYSVDSGVVTMIGGSTN